MCHRHGWAVKYVQNRCVVSLVFDTLVCVCVYVTITETSENRLKTATLPFFSLSHVFRFLHDFGASFSSVCDVADVAFNLFPFFFLVFFLSVDFSAMYVLAGTAGRSHVRMHESLWLHTRTKTKKKQQKLYSVLVFFCQFENDANDRLGQRKRLHFLYLCCFDDWQRRIVHTRSIHITHIQTEARARSPRSGKSIHRGALRTWLEIHSVLIRLACQCTRHLMHMRIFIACTFLADDSALCMHASSNSNSNEFCPFSELLLGSERTCFRTKRFGVHSDIRNEYGS